ncbi:MAG: DUF1232 domain-containing protein [Dehalococcoidia bacterium]
MTHPDVPLRLKLLPVVAVVYFVLPRDLFFDYRPFGFLDDFIIGSILLGAFTSKATKYLDREKRAKEEAVKVEFKVIDEDAEEDGKGEQAESSQAGHGDEPPQDQEPPKEDLRG